MLSNAESHFLKTGLRLDGTKPTENHIYILRRNIQRKLDAYAREIPLLIQNGFDVPRPALTSDAPAGTIKFEESE